MGRGRVQLKLIENKIRRQVTFSKRRSGLLKKAQEISVLCDAEVGLIIFSTKGKLFEFSTDSSMERIVERYEQHTYFDKRTSNDCECEENGGLQYSKLAARIELLQRNIRNYAGDNLDPLSWRELQNLEQQIDNSLKRIRIRMERSLREQNNLLAKQLKENEKQQIEESNKQEKEGFAKSTSTFKLPKPLSELHGIRALNICGSPHKTRDEGHDNQVQVGSTIPPWMLRINANT